MISCSRLPAIIYCVPYFLRKSIERNRFTAGASSASRRDRTRMRRRTVHPSSSPSASPARAFSGCAGASSASRRAWARVRRRTFLARTAAARRRRRVATMHWFAAESTAPFFVVPHVATARWFAAERTTPFSTVGTAARSVAGLFASAAATPSHPRRKALRYSSLRKKSSSASLNYRCTSESPSYLYFSRF